MKKIEQQLKALKLTETFIEKLKDVVEEEGYKYIITTSCAPISLYNVEGDKVVKAHIEHIAEDNLIENNYELVLSNGYISNEDVVAELLFRKKI